MPSPILPPGTRPPVDEGAFLEWLAPRLPPALTEMNVPCYVLDRSGRIRWLNPAATRLLGDVRGSLYTSVLDSSDAQRAHARFERQLRGLVQPDVTAELHGVDGRSTRVEISSVPLRGSHHAIGVFGLALPLPLPLAAPRRRDGRELTSRQWQMLEFLAAGASTEQIARQLHLSEETVRNHIRHMLRRLGARSRLEAVAIAHRDGLV